MKISYPNGTDTYVANTIQSLGESGSETLQSYDKLHMIEVNTDCTSGSFSSPQLGLQHNLFAQCSHSLEVTFHELLYLLLESSHLGLSVL